MLRLVGSRSLRHGSPEAGSWLVSRPWRNAVVSVERQCQDQARCRHLSTTAVKRKIQPASTSTSTSAVPPPPPTNQQHPHNRQKWSRRGRILLYIVIFGYIGNEAANRVAKNFTGPIAQPGSAEDLQALETIKTRFDQLPVVRSLRDDADWIEWEPYGNFTDEQRERQLTTGPLRGSRGVSCQRIFYNEKKNTIQSILFLGTAVEGWPTIVHGGMIATLLDENLGRIAIRNFPARTGVTANLNVSFRAPLMSSQFVIVEARYDAEKSSERKAVVEGELKDVFGVTHAEASGLFVQPKKLQLERIESF